MSDQRDHWTGADYETLSWHDNHFYGFAVREGPDGTTGELIFDLDFITEWRKDDQGFLFGIAPATLTFHEVSDLKIELDYVQPQGAITPFSVSNIGREPLVFPSGYTTFKWELGVNWPEGVVSFLASGFTQKLRSAPRYVREQRLPADARSAPFAG